MALEILTAPISNRFPRVSTAQRVRFFDEELKGHERIFTPSALNLNYLSQILAAFLMAPWYVVHGFFSFEEIVYENNIFLFMKKMIRKGYF